MLLHMILLTVMYHTYIVQNSGGMKQMLFANILPILLVYVNLKKCIITQIHSNYANIL